jgi:hypothetical protein
MFDALLGALLGCRHRRTSLPFTPHPGTRREPVLGERHTYVVCLDCGKQFPYNWDEMRQSRSSTETQSRES